MLHSQVFAQPILFPYRPQMDAYTLPAQRDASDQSDNPAGDSTSRRRPDVAFNITRYLVGSDGSIVSEVPGIGMSF